MPRVPVLSRPKVARYFGFTGATPRVEVTSDASLLITSDIDIQVLFQRTSAVQFGALMTRLDFFGNAYGFFFSIENQVTNRLNYRWSPTGAAGGLVSRNTSTTFVPVALGTPIWLRVTHDVDNGASGNDIRFFWGSHNGTVNPPAAWTQIGATVTTAGVTTISNPTTQGVAVGSFGSGASQALPTGAKIYRGIVKNGIGGPIIVDLDASNLDYSTNPPKEPAGNRNVTISGGVASLKTRPTASGRVSAP